MRYILLFVIWAAAISSGVQMERNHLVVSFLLIVVAGFISALRDHLIEKRGA